MRLAGSAMRRAFTGRLDASRPNCQCGFAAWSRRPNGRQASRVCRGAAAATSFAAAVQVVLRSSLSVTETQAGDSFSSAQAAEQANVDLSQKKSPRVDLQPGWHEGRYSIWRGDGTPATFEDLVASAAESDVVLMGEEHDDRVTHALQLDLLSALHSRVSNTRQLALAMEMFETDVQPVIDDYLAGYIREQDFLMDARPWNNYAADYRPLVEFAKDHGLAVMASNAPRRYVSLLGRGGGQASLEALSPASRTLLPPLPIPPPSEAYRQIFMGHMAPAMRARDVVRSSESVWVLATDGQTYEVEAIVANREGQTGKEYLVKWLGFSKQENSWERADSLQGDVQRLLSGRTAVEGQNAGTAAISSGTAQASVDGACPYIGFDHTKLNTMLEAQCLWDASMAWTLAKFYDRTPETTTDRTSCAKPIVLHVNGSFHSRGRRGIPERLDQYCAPGSRLGTHAGPGPRCLVVTCASSGDVATFPAHLAAFSSTGGTGDDFIILTDDMVSPSFEIEHPI